MSEDLPDSSKCDELIRIRGKRSAPVDDEPQENDPPVDPILVKHIKLEENVEVNVIPQLNILFHLHSDVWRLLFRYMSDSDVVALSSVCTHFQQIVRDLKSGFNLSRNYNLDTECFLNYALSKVCTSIDINYCKWLTPSTINEMIAKSNLQHLHLIQCRVDEDNCVRSICNLHLQSLSFTYTKEWRSHFIKYAEKSLPIFSTLSKLVIGFSQPVRPLLGFKSGSILHDVYVNVLQHCKDLQQFKLFENFNSGYIWYDTLKSSKFPAQSTSLLKLTSLKLALEHETCLVDALNFLKAILKDKVIPLKNVDFGRCTCYLLKSGILNHPLILPNGSKFILRSNGSNYKRCGLPEEIGNENYEIYEDKLCNWISQSTYETVFVECVNFRDFAPFVEKISSTSQKSIKRVHVLKCSISKNTAKGIELFAINCPHITVLHLIVNVTTRTIGDYYNYEIVTENEVILEALSNFKNLKVLVISSNILQCEYNIVDGSHRRRSIKIQPFWKVTKGCEQLNEISFQRSERTIPTIHSDSLYDIAHCKNLKVLRLDNFDILGEENFRPAEITKACAKIEHLSIGNISIQGHSYLKLGDSLSYVKELKILRIGYQKRYMTNAFLNSLCLCEKLEDIFLYVNSRINCNERGDDVLSVMQVLPKLKNLFVAELELSHEDSINKNHLNSLFEKIKKERPSFYGSVSPEYCIEFL